ncbi:ABC transporter ATP-binding protein [Ahrensia sp. R2A130]|uniref:ABC transporter ATP-binding protein n=1 Tax=Ahrensia sp. R2A130 TaxID=744979 RepID=UPI0001E0ACE7|nr:ABC transporter ATP-binding protein [Ahrensia sp. R2A130]EFL87738.1 ABC-transporter [Ahrensia sp. R2A130]
MVEPILSTAAITKRFGALTACDAVDFDLRAGEIHALIGPNGAGKSTFIRQITGEQVPDEGEVSFDGANINALDVPRRSAAGLARTFQISSLIDDFTALENVMLAVQGHSRRSFSFFRRAANDKALTEPAMTHLTDAGLGSRANEKAASLSHGERRQLELGMALALKPKVFLMDEPMAGIGPGGSVVLTSILDGLRAQAPILLVEHDMDAVFALADRVTVLVGGKVIAHGSVDDIRSDPQVREAYLGEGA